MILKLIGCDVLMREICHSVAKTPHVMDIEFTEKGSHDKPDYLRQLIQERIDACQADEKSYDAIILGYGVCGNSTIGLIARDTPLVIPRAHDCCTLFLGSKAKFREHFGDRPSTGFSSSGYLERGDSYVREANEIHQFMGLDKTYEEYVRQYGEENARYIWETLHPEQSQAKDNSVIFIDIPETRHLGYAERCRRQAEEDGKEYIQLEGDISLILSLIFGEWNDDDFLVVPPHKRIVGVYDLEEIVRVEDA